MEGLVGQQQSCAILPSLVADIIALVLHFQLQIRKQLSYGVTGVVH